MFENAQQHWNLAPYPPAVGEESPRRCSSTPVAQSACPKELTWKQVCRLGVHIQTRVATAYRQGSHRCRDTVALGFASNNALGIDIAIDKCSIFSVRRNYPIFQPGLQQEHSVSSAESTPMYASSGIAERKSRKGRTETRQAPVSQ